MAASEDARYITRMSRIPVLLDYLAQKPDDRFARYALALEFKKAGDLDRAETEFRELLAKHPGSGAGHFQLGGLYRDADRLADARAAWEAGLVALATVDDAEARRSIGEIRRALAEIEDD